MDSCPVGTVPVPVQVEFSEFEKLLLALLGAALLARILRR